jgi:hypothetical protein
VVITDTRGSWASPWILTVARAGLMEVYPNHTFQPASVVRRVDLADTASSALTLMAASNPRLGTTLQNARGRFPDVPPGHLNYQAASAAVATGVMATTADGTFQLSRPITGQEAVAAVGKLVELSGRQAR